MQSCAVALGKYNIRANAVLPGTIETDINKSDLSDVAKREGMVKRTVLGRLGGALSSTSGYSQLADGRNSSGRYRGTSCVLGQRPGKVRDWCTGLSGWWVVRQFAINWRGHVYERDRLDRLLTLSTHR